MMLTMRAWFIVGMITCLSFITAGFAGAASADEAADSRGLAAPLADQEIDFNRDIRPLLSKNCFQCHGFDEQGRQGGLRLDRADGATAVTDSGSRAIVPGKPDESVLLQLLRSTDPQLRMPPESSGKSLSAAQISLLQRWIETGGRYADHWAFIPPARPKVPETASDDWSRNAIDRFVLHRLRQEGLQPTVEADPARLLRRVSLDLVGLPPTSEELDEYLNQAQYDPDAAYEQAVDRLLNSPHFGERMAIDWLDAARYADTNGYFGDRPRQAWPWRDWVIAAFNANLPFDQFTIEQLAGDQLPAATRDQRIATGFHRNSMANNETGITDEEYRVEAVADRVETTASVWLGMTVGCAQCHDHKYDPISQQEYYQLFAYFNNSVEPGLIYADSPPPTIEVPTVEQVDELARRQQRLTELEARFSRLSSNLEEDLNQWQQSALSELSPPVQDTALSYDFDQDQKNALSIGTTIKKQPGIRGEAGQFDATQHVEVPLDFQADAPWTISVWFKSTGSVGCLISKIEPVGRRRGLEVLWQKGHLHLHLVHQWGVDEIVAVTQEKLSQHDWHHAVIQYDGSHQSTGLRLIVDGRPAPLTIRHDQLMGSIECDEPLRIGRRDTGLGFYGLLDQITVVPSLVSEGDAETWYYDERLRGILERPVEKRVAAETNFLKQYYIDHRAAPEIKAAHVDLQRGRESVAELRRQIPTTLVMEDRQEFRPTHVLLRGQYDQPGAEVHAGVPAIFPSVEADAPRNRLTLAKWLVSGRHPLTARVTVNRLWQQLFGEGLVRTVNDFGSQGDLPTHPQLLDSLAVEFVDSGWDIKRMLRLIVTSATYRQSSNGTEELLQRDPENRLLAHGPRFRLPAELLRDQALAAAGLLTRTLGGPSAKPYQPEGLWEEVSYNGDDSYVEETGDNLWRRSLYTYHKRQAPPPAQLIFDAGTREKCQVRRLRTNTPLQALLTLNDPTWIEASRVLAEAATASSRDDQRRLISLFRQVVSRSPDPQEIALLIGLLERQRARFGDDLPAAEQLVRVGTAPGNSQLDAREVAAWTIVVHTLFNLDEVITRR